MTALTFICTAAALAGALLATVMEAEAADVFDPPQADIARVAAMLPAKPGGLGPRVSDRAAWQRVATRKEVRAAITRAVELLASPLPPMTDDDYLDYSRTGNRDRGQAAQGARRSRIPILALAECAEDKGRFLPALEETLLAVCEEKSWVLPAHDGNLQTFEGRLITIDLGAAGLAWGIAVTDYLLGERLSADTRAVIRREMERRIFAPYRLMCAGKQAQYWLIYKMNWNSVCLAGVTGAALALLDDPKVRAWYALAAEHYSLYSLEGFTPDGYCDEGVSYWNYGWGHYVAMAEAVRSATGNGIDLLARDKAVMPSGYGYRIEMVTGVCPAFADCPVTAAPSPGLVDYLSRRFTGKSTLRSRAVISGGLGDQVMALFPQRLPLIRQAVAWPERDPLRTWFPDMSVLVARPKPGSESRLGVAVQGGHNAQNHNHNDVGGFMVVVGKTAVLPDVGAEVYTQRTFSTKRYDSPALNSWGHAVPVVAGRLQNSGRRAEARVLKEEFGADQDTLVLDMEKAYTVPTLTRLERAFKYSRAGQGSLTVTDMFAFSTPETFETALMTFGTWERLDATTLVVRDGAEAVRVSIGLPPGAEMDVVAEEVKANLTARRKATRIGLRLKRPVAEGTVALVITPLGGSPRTGQ